MPRRFEPKTAILPKSQHEIWPLLAPAPGLSFVLYGGTAVALYLGHRTSVDFDFFRSAPLDKKEIEASFAFVRDAETIQEAENTLVIMAADAVRSRKGVVFRKHEHRKDQRTTPNQRLDTSRCLDGGFARHETKEHFGPGRGQGLPRYFHDDVGRRLLGEGIRRVRQDVREGPRASSASDRFFQRR